MAFVEAFAAQAQARWRLKARPAALEALRAAAACARAPASFAPGGRALLAAGAGLAGIAAWFAAPVDPPLWLAIFMGLAAAAAGLAARRRGRGDAAGFVCLLVAFACAGYARAEHRVRAVVAPVVAETQRAREVEGWVERIDAGTRGRRYVLRVTAFEGGAAPGPFRVRVSGAAGRARLGDAVRVRAVLRPPPGPAVPGGYDFSRSAYYQRLGGVGYVISAFEPADIEGLGLAERFERALAAVRGRLAARLRASGGARAGPMIAALVTGDRSEIADADAERLRASGLGHILAISGMHMALVGGGAFFAFSFVFARVAPVARRWNTRKLAAACALAACAGYLMLSGASTPTQRAFVMAGLAFLAIIFDRRALSLRAVAAAACVVLLLAPESALTPGFQMSFAAAACLIAVHDALRRRARARGPEPDAWPEPARALQRVFTGAASTSLIAGLATAPFAAYHFNRLAAYGFAANLFAMPVFSLVVMPFSMLAALAAPFGLDAPFAWIASLGARAVYAIAGGAAGSEAALRPVASGAPLALALVGASIVLGCALSGARTRIAGALALAAIAAWRLAPQPDLWIGAGGGLALVERRDGRIAAYADLGRGERYGAEQFARRAGLAPSAELAGLDERFACDASGCAGRAAGRVIALTRTLDALAQDCARADVVVLQARAPPRLRARCDAILLDAGHGAPRAVRLNADGAQVLATRPRRRWALSEAQ